MKSLRNVFTNPFQTQTSKPFPTPSDLAAQMAPPSSSTSTSTSTSTTATTTNPLKAPIPVTLLELFQSQGCNSCPPANDFLTSLSSSPAFTTQNLLLTYEVTYWDHLGWRDTFGDSRWDARQTAYARALRQRSCYTPQVLIDGGAKPVGGSWRNVPSVLATSKPEGNLAFGFAEGGRVLRVVGGWGQRGLVVVVVFYEGEPEPVRILRGENGGVTERYRNVVRDMQVLGTWEGGEVVVELPTRRKGLEMAVLVQAGNGGVILGAARV